MSLPPDQKTYLLNLARQTIEDYFNKHQKPEIDVKKIDPILAKPAATFVTLTKNGELRGCIGSLIARKPLFQNIIDNSLLAAFADNRFPQVEESELDTIKIEISVLLESKPYQYHNADILLKVIQPNKHGIIIQNGFNQATFLPQVWGDLPDKTQFLEALCQKANLDKNAWRDPSSEIFFYTVENFSE